MEVDKSIENKGTVVIQQQLVHIFIIIFVPEEQGLFPTVFLNKLYQENRIIHSWTFCVNNTKNSSDDVFMNDDCNQ